MSDPKKVLVVDDDPRIALSIAVRLKQEGHEVFSAHDGVSAVSSAIKNSPDLMILDISMPAGNGLVVAERVRENIATATMPIIFITASRKPGLEERAQKFDPVAFFEKPYVAEELLDVVRETLYAETA